MFEEELELDFFRDNDFVRKVCPQCKAGFWTVDHEKELCGDSGCCGYAFIDNPLIKGDYDLDSMRRKFLDFFNKNDHTELAPYPVVARWRDDIYLTIASIADFQPHVTSGLVKPPANPLAISQPCIRLNDLDNVGRSGRHLSMFEMMGHHVFNNPAKQIYWKEETVQYCSDFLINDLKVPASEITYREEPWFGGGNAGPALETEVGGLEVATLVFMNMARDNSGKYLVGGNHYSKMDMNIVDTGYGLERFLWMSKGTPSIYEAIYPELIDDMFDRYGVDYDLNDSSYKDMVVEHVNLCGQMDISSGSGLSSVRNVLCDNLKKKGHDLTIDELERKMKPLENIFIMADHTKALTFMLADGVVPSNIKAGYLARLLIRRSLRYADDLCGELDVNWLVERHISSLKNFPSIVDNQDRILEMMDRETRKYRDTLSKGKRMVSRIMENMDREVKGDEIIPMNKLIDLYDSHGIHPSIVKNVLEDDGRKFTVPDGFSQLLAEKHAQKKETEIQEEITVEYEPTELLFYDDEYCSEARAKVLASTLHGIVLDKTIFYPEGGGQPADRGILESGGNEYRVKNVLKYDGVVFHIVSNGEDVELPEPGCEVNMKIDMARRRALMRHHTATHIVLGAARRVLGSHVWQQGAQKFPDRARFDISHFKRLTPEEVVQIENEANLAVLSRRNVNKKWYTLDEAMDRFGSELFQGGPPKGENVRIVEIEGWDREACAGTHVNNTTELGMIKIIHTERLQDGVERLEYSAGMAAVAYVQTLDRIIEKARLPFGVPPDKLPETSHRFFDEWKAQKKEIKRLKTEVAENKRSALITNAERIGDIGFVFHRTSADMGELQALGRELTSGEKTVVMLVSDRSGAKMLLARSDDVEVDMNELLKKGMVAVRGGGGGRPNFAQGGGSYPEGIDKAREIVVSLLKERLVQD